MSRRLRGATLLTALAVVSASAEGAAASTLEIDTGFRYNDTFELTAAPGEQNHVTVTDTLTTGLDPSSRLVLRDPRLTTLLGDALQLCTRPIPDTAVCEPSREDRYIGSGKVSLGDGNDTARAVGIPAYYYGGPGNDTIAAAPNVTDQLIGGPGADDLDGGGSLTGAALPLYAADTAWYDEKEAGVTVRIDNVANDGVPGEGDNVHRDIARVRGSGFDDVLVGSPEANQLEGDAGDDLIVGRGGSDILYGDQGGGAGDDRVDSRDGVRDIVLCGEGADMVWADWGDDVRPDCENVQRF